MKALSKIVFFVFFAFATQVVEATSLPMLSVPVNSGPDYAARIVAGQCNGGCALVAEALVRSGQIAVAGDAQAYLTNAEVRPSCPGGTRILSSVVGGDLGTITRPYRQGESCLWDRNTGLVIGSASCGNIDMGRRETASANERVVVGPQGPPGRDGRDGRTVVIESGIQILGYKQGTPDRMSDRARVEITRQVFETVQTGIVVAGLNSLGRRYIDGQVRREEIRAGRDIDVAAWDSRRGPSHVSVVGNCNGVFGTANCTAPREVIREVPVDRPIYIPVDRPVHVPRPEPGVSPPVFGPEPGVNPPIIGGVEPGVSPPIFRGIEPGVGPGSGAGPGVGGPIFGDGGARLPAPSNPVEPGN